MAGSIDMSDETTKITSVTPEQAAKILSSAYKRQITPQQVQQIVEDAELLREDGTFSLIEYAAWLAREIGNV